MLTKLMNMMYPGPASQAFIAVETDYDGQTVEFCGATATVNRIHEGQLHRLLKHVGSGKTAEEAIADLEHKIFADLGVEPTP